MIIDALKNSLRAFIERPSIVAPLLVAIVLGLVIGSLVTSPVADLMIKFLDVEPIPQSNAFNTVIYFYQQFAPEINAMAVMGLLGFILQGMALYWLAGIINAKKNNAWLSELGRTIKSIPRLIALVLFLAVVAAVFLVVVFLGVFTLLKSTGIILILALLLIALIGIFLVLHWLLAIPIMSVEDANTGQSLSMSWDFTSKHLFGVIFLLIVLTVLSAIVSMANEWLFLNMASEGLRIGLQSVLGLFVGTLSSSLLVYYYLEDRQKKKKF